MTGYDFEVLKRKKKIRTLYTNVKNFVKNFFYFFKCKLGLK